MIKILVNSPKGGVGKTTLATNIALFLAREGFRIWALDLAQGEQMSDDLASTNIFKQPQNKIEIDEMGRIPTSFRGARQYDFLVADTDDYYKIMSYLFSDDITRGWRVIVPIVNERNGLIRIPNEIHQVMVANMMRGQKPIIKLFVNKYENDSDYDSVKDALKEKNLERLLSDNCISYCNGIPPFFINDDNFNEDITKILREMEVF